MNPTKPKPAIVAETVTVTRRRGVNATARRLGVSRTHLSRVLSGERRAGARLAAGLRRLGVELPSPSAGEGRA